jgi:hypothetical protein
MSNAQNKITEFKYQYDQEKVNTAGQREGELVHTYEKIEYKHLYKNGKLIEATNYLLTVEGKKPLIGKYKDGNPFQGYFVYANEMEIPLIDYYENGIFVAQCTCLLLDLIQNEGRESQLKWIKTIYKNNKPWEGLYHREEYNIGGAHLMASEYYKNGLITDVELWLMAENYAELIKIKFLSDGYTIYKEKMPSGGDPEIDRKPRTITVHFKDSKNGNVLFDVENKLVRKYQFINADLSQKIKPVPGNVSYSFDDSTVIFVQRYDFETNKKLYNDAYGYNQNIMAQIFMGLDNQPIPYFTPDGDNDYSSIFQLEKGFNSNSILYLKENGNPSRGFFIEKETQSDNYKYTQYLDSKVIKNGNSLSLKEIEKLMLEKE